MGLIKKGYVLKNLNNTVLAEAYAAIKAISINDGRGEALFTISDRRENAIKGIGYETVRVRFTPDRNESPYITAYKTAKAVTSYDIINSDTGEKTPVTEPNSIFTDWEDDIEEPYTISGTSEERTDDDV